MKPQRKNADIHIWASKTVHFWRLKEQVSVQVMWFFLFLYNVKKKLVSLMEYKLDFSLSVPENIQDPWLVVFKSMS